ncbi:hypothetical protein FNV43_RR11173 [Rhamnella rubrinervis]|uniref:BHLH domain-containing protein n=1 Tax=Rhamnella rubrinervis TaxID=2594499 RepID=A0A8K0H5S4_9ROSA|nr:hypothetical protein FNV43_RR11173 [Rhamnella rubrinervis]
MGEDCGSWHPQLHSDWQPPNLNFLGSPLDLGRHNLFSAYTNLGANMVSTNCTLPVYASAEVPQLRAGQASEPNGWFYCLPHYRQAITPAPNSILKDKFSASPSEGCNETMKPKAEPWCAQKRFLVIDQSGDQTTLIFSSGIGTPVQCLASLDPNSHNAHNLNGEDGGTKRDVKNLSEPILTDELNEDNEIDVQSEMHEDTEELNALLYSDDESDSTEDDEVTSTGHSPSTMTDFDRQNWFNGSTEEVASSAGTTKKRKLFDGACDDKPSIKDTATSVKPILSFDLEDDAESSCANNKIPELRKLDSLSSNKRVKREKIRETISMLQNIIPGGRGKDAIVVLDEAIQYLKSLKVKAKAFRFDAL